MAIIKLNNNALTSVTELPSGLGGDPDVKVDIARLGLRVFSNQNLAKQNSNSASFDVFQDSSGITNLTQTQRYTDEYVSSAVESFSSDSYDTSNRQGSYSVAHSGLGSINGHPQNGLDGNTSNNNSNAWHFQTNNTNISGAYISFDLGSGNSKIYTGAKIVQDRQQSCGNWKWQGSDDGSNYTDLSSSFDWGNVGNPYVTETTWSNTTAYRYLRVFGLSGNTHSSPWQNEFYFRTKTSSVTYNATGSFEGATITAGASTSKMGAVITYQDNAGTNALNSDLVLKLSADNGSNYSTATLTALPDFSSGVKCCSVADLSVTAGSQLKYKLEFANQSSGSKECRVTGVSLQY